jgi:hypothetical protein
MVKGGRRGRWGGGNYSRSERAEPWRKEVVFFPGGTGDRSTEGSHWFLAAWETRRGEQSSEEGTLRLPAVAYSKWYSKVLEYEYRVKTAVLGTLKRYSILSLTLYLE